MKEALSKVSLWLKGNKLNLNPDKTRYMIFNCKTDMKELIHIENKFIERVWEKGREKSFKLVGILSYLLLTPMLTPPLRHSFDALMGQGHADSRPLYIYMSTYTTCMYVCARLTPTQIKPE